MPTSKSRTPAGRARAATKSPAPARPTRGARAQARTAAPQKHAPAKPAKPANGARPVKVDKPADPAKAGRVRDKFTMPEADYALIGKLKLSARRTGLKAKKGELLRLGLRALDALSATDLQDRLLTMRVHDKRSAKHHGD